MKVDFNGRTVFCIASGPSLTESDCAAIERSGHPTIAVNSSWKMARFADAIYAGDYNWWEVNLRDIDIPAQRWTCSHYANQMLGINLHRAKGTLWNSGLRAVEFAISLGAARIVLVGYDCSVKKGEHWHGPHQKTTNPNPQKCANWKKQFELLAQETTIQIINCSRDTELKCFPRAPLENYCA